MKGQLTASAKPPTGPPTPLSLVLADPTLTALRLTGPQISLKFGLNTETVDISSPARPETPEAVVGLLDSISDFPRGDTEVHREVL